MSDSWRTVRVSLFSSELEPPGFKTLAATNEGLLKGQFYSDMTGYLSFLVDKCVAVIS